MIFSFLCTLEVFRSFFILFFFFFFQAEDGIRDLTVTGVQTCALPIFIICSPNYLDGRDEYGTTFASDFFPLLSHLGEFFRDSWNQESDVFLVEEVCKGAYELQIGRRRKQSKVACVF